VSEKERCEKAWKLFPLCKGEEIVIHVKGGRGNNFIRGVIVDVSDYAILIMHKGKKKVIRFSEIRSIEEAED